MDPFIFKLGLSFVVGSLFAAATLCIAARYGPRIGGIVSGLPSTTAVGLFFIGYTQSPEAASTAATIVPAAVAGSLIFVIVYIYLSKKRDYLYSILAASIVWFAIALPLANSGSITLWTASLIYLFAWLIAHAYLGRIKAEVKDAVVKQTWKHIAVRSMFAGLVIATAVLAGRILGPFWGGTLASFPAMFLSLFVILRRDYGWEYTARFAKTIPTGLFAVVPYAWAVHYFYPQYGLIMGTMIAYAIAIPAAGLLYLAQVVRQK